ncbi:zinc finger protein 665-like [Antennarius striatus]|uniref:zinc finger protein 665-like n=1 Tax=Antennarius striatus TaxID=241820 RepID=UPI0035AFEC10
MTSDPQLLLPLCSSGSLEAVGPGGASSPRAEMDTLRTLVTERLAAAVDDILEVFVRTVVRYREQIELQRRQLDVLRAAEEKRNRAAAFQQLLLNQEEVLVEQQDGNPSPDQENPPEPQHVKEEQERLWTNQGGESDVTEFRYSPAPVKSEEDEEDEEEEEEEEEEPQFSALHQDEGMRTDSDECEQSDPGKQVKMEPDQESDEDAGGRQTFGHPSRINQSDAMGGGMIGGSVFEQMFRQTGSVTRRLTLLTGQKEFSCSVCGKTFSHKRTLNRHLVSHTGERPYSCSVCGKRFARKENLKQHFVLHTGEKPFSCAVCGKTFAQHGTMSRHVSVHLSEKPFSCSVCGKEFARKENLKRHSSVHDKESPSVTSKFFKTFSGHFGSFILSVYMFAPLENNMVSSAKIRHLNTEDAGEKREKDVEERESPLEQQILLNPELKASVLKVWLKVRLREGELGNFCPEHLLVPIGRVLAPDPREAGLSYQRPAAASGGCSDRPDALPSLLFILSSSSDRFLLIMTSDPQLLLPLCSSGSLEAVGPGGSSSPRAEMDTLRTLVTERLAAAVDDILEVFVRTVVRYREQIELQRRQLDVLRAAEEKRNRAADPLPVPSWIKLCPEDLNLQLDQPDRSDRMDAAVATHIKTEAASGDCGEPSSDPTGGSPGNGRLLADWSDPVGLWNPEDLQEPPVSPQTSPDPPPQTPSAFSCKVCGEPFQRVRHLFAHSSAHLSDCGVCGKRLEAAENLKLHLGTHREAAFRCGVCGQSFTLRGNLRTHMRIHSGERPFACTVCGKSFGRRATLVRHVRSHTGEKPFACSYCGRGFVEKGNLTVHLRTHTGEDSYVCAVCGRAFTQRSHWAKHVQVHRKVDPKADKSYTCDICGKRLTRFDGYQKHLRIHTGEKPYRCDECGRRFSDNSNYKRHIRRHGGQKLQQS